jgi:lipoyl(octanoyl) transferase
MRRCTLIATGRPVDYQTGLELQAEAAKQVLEGVWDGVVILLEHQPVITIGRDGGEENLYIDSETLKSRGVELRRADRGGNITCHNPGQLVGYPILNLRRWKEDVHWYVDSLEEVLIATLAHYGLKSGRKARYTGVWLDDEKIAAIGVSVKKWVTGHGFALNVKNNLDLFQAIVPCGIRQFGVTSMAGQGVEAKMSDVAGVLSQEFARVFECEVTKSGEAKN